MKKIENTLPNIFMIKKKNFKIQNIECDKVIDPNLKLALDKPDDLIRIEKWEQSRNEDYDKLFPIIETK